MTGTGERVALLVEVMGTEAMSLTSASKSDSKLLLVDWDTNVESPSRKHAK